MENATLLVIGLIFLSIGFLGDLAQHPYQAYVCGIVALVLFVKTIVGSRPNMKPSITIEKERLSL